VHAVNPVMETGGVTTGTVIHVPPAVGRYLSV